MSNVDNEQLHPAVVALAEDFEHRQGQWAVPVDKLHPHLLALQGCGRELRERLLTDLLVLAARFEREAPAAATTALAQLLALAALLLGDAREAEAAFERADLQVAEAKKLIGGRGLQFSDDGKPAPGQAAASLLGMLKGNK